MSARQICALIFFNLVLFFTSSLSAQTSESAAIQNSIRALQTQLKDLQKAPDIENDELLLEHLHQKQRLITDLQNEISRLVVAVEREAEMPDTQRATARDLVAEQSKTLNRSITSLRAIIDSLRAKRTEASVSESLVLEQRLRNYDQLLADVLRMYYVNTQRGVRIGRDGVADFAKLDDTLQQRAKLLAERMALVLERLDGAKSRLAQTQDGDKGAIQAELSILRERKDRLKFGLTETISLMRERDLDVAEYSQFLIRTTGEISGDILDRRVLSGLANDWLQVVRATIVEQGPTWVFKLIVFFSILFVFWVISRLVKRVVRRTVSASRMHFSILLQNFFVRVSSSLVLLAGLFIALAQLGVQLGPVLAGLGVAGFILGFALQETLSNFAAGLMILVYRPFDVGDVVEAGGVNGKVHQMSLVSTTILTFDNQKLIVPNSKIWGNVIRNVNAESTRRVDLLFSISYADDVDAAQHILEQLVAGHPAVLAEPEPRICLHTLGESSVDFICRPWVNSADYWQVYWDLTKQVKQSFDAADITIPFPQRELHISAAQAALVENKMPAVETT